MKRSRVLSSLLIVISLALVLVSPAYLSNSYGYTTTSGNWNGLRNFTSEMQAHPMENLVSLGSLNPNTSALFIIQPVKSFSQEQISSVKGFISAGGLVVLAANNGSANQLLSSMGVDIQLTDYAVLDSVLNYGRVSQPILSNLTGVQVSLNSSLVLDSPMALELSGSAQALSYSSSFAYARNSTGPNLPGSYALIALEHIGNGSILVVGTPGPLLNAFFNVYGNHAFFESLVGSRNSFIDTSHWRIPLLTIWQDELGAFVSIRILNLLEYSLIISFLGICVLLATSDNVQGKGSKVKMRF